MYEAVTADEYEFPICFGRTQRELACKLGVSETMVYYAVQTGSTSRTYFNKQKYRIVQVDDNEQTEEDNGV